MKISFLVFIILFGIQINLLCQIQKGTYFIGGLLDYDLSISRGKDNLDRLYRNQTTLEVSPNLGYFMTEKLVVGSQISFIHFSQKYSKGDKFHENSYIFSVFLRYYLYSKLFSELDMGIGMKTWDTSSLEKFRILNSSIDLGYSIFLSKTIALEPLLSIGYTNESKRENGFNLNTLTSDFSIRLIYCLHLKE